VPRRALFGLLDLSSNVSMYYFVLIVFLIVLCAIWRIVHSPFGQILHAIRDNEQRAISLGYHVHHYKILLFVLSAAFAGLAGGLKCLVVGFATLTDVYWHASGEVVLMTMLGGVGTMLGPVVGAALVVGIQNYFAELGAWVTMIQGAIFVVVVMVFRRGIVGELIPLLHGRLGRVRQRATSSHTLPAAAAICPIPPGRPHSCHRRRVLCEGDGWHAMRFLVLQHAEVEIPACFAILRADCIPWMRSARPGAAIPPLEGYDALISRRPMDVWQEDRHPGSLEKSPFGSG
jgi:MFS family permease